MDGAHALAAQFVQEISTFLAQDLVRDRLDLEAAVGVQRKKRTSIEIHGVDGPAVGGQKNRLLLEAPFDGVAARSLRLGGDRHQSPTRKVRLNQINAVLGCV